MNGLFLFYFIFLLHFLRIEILVILMLHILGVVTMYLPVSITGFVIYGDVTLDNVLRSLPDDSWLRLTAEGLITAHLLCAFVIAINPFSQEFEELFHVPHSK